jgi:NADPH:quinone reductase-like Zn-dependent oxidoreductase
MKAIVCREYGSPDVLQIKKLPQPEPRENEALVKVVARRSIFTYKRALSPKGICVFTGGTTAAIFQSLLLAPLLSMTGDRKMGVVMWKPNSKEDLALLEELFEDGEVVPVIDKRYPLSKVPEALRYLGEGRAQGKVVITLEHDNGSWQAGAAGQ